jgi:hypothetical protein
MSKGSVCILSIWALRVPKQVCQVRNASFYLLSVCLQTDQLRLNVRDPLDLKLSVSESDIGIIPSLLNDWFESGHSAVGNSCRTSSLV